MSESERLHAKMVEFAERAEAAEFRRQAARDADPRGRSAEFAVADEEVTLANSMLRDIGGDWREAVRRELYPPARDYRFLWPVGMAIICALAILGEFWMFRSH